jgi:hypothetical protein
MMLRIPRFAVVGALLFACSACSSTLPPPSTPAEARPLLERALDAWKDGDKPDALQSGTPPIRILEPDWSAGWSLVDYKLLGNGNPLGLRMQYIVELDLKDPRGKARKKTMTYLVSTGSMPMISREDPEN